MPLFSNEVCINFYATHGKWSEEYEVKSPRSPTDEDRSSDEDFSFEQASSGDDYFAEYFPNIFEEGTSFNSWESEGEVSDVSSAAGFMLPRKILKIKERNA